MSFQIKPWGLPIEFALEADETCLSTKGQVLYWQSQYAMWTKVLFHLKHESLGDINARVIFDALTQTNKLYVGGVLVLEIPEYTRFINAIERKIEYASIKFSAASAKWSDEGHN